MSTSKPDLEFVEVPKEMLTEEALQGLLQEFILREGTDYGHSEASLEVKLAGLRRQMENGRLVIAFSVSEESCTLLTKEEFRKKQLQAEQHDLP